jgi:hypothetical protein
MRHLLDQLERDLLACAKVTWEQPCWIISSFPTDPEGRIYCIQRDNASCCLVGARPELAANCCIFMDCDGSC